MHTFNELAYKSFFVMLLKHCGNCTYAISWPDSSSMKKHRASLTDSELLEYMSQSTLRIISPLLILDDTLIYSFSYDNEKIIMIIKHTPIHHCMCCSRIPGYSWLQL